MPGADRRACGRARWATSRAGSTSTNLHLTVRFLGETPPDLTPDAALAVRDALEGARAFDVVLAGAGSFPEARKPRALWLGIEQGAAELGALADALDPALEPLGWPRDDRPYRPHLTVARLDRSSISSSEVIADELRAAAADWRTSFRADRVVLLPEPPGRRTAALRAPRRGRGCAS